MKRFPYGKSVYGIMFVAFLFVLLGARLLYSAENQIIRVAFFLLGFGAMFIGYASRITSFMNEVFADLDRDGIHFPRRGRGSQRLIVRFLLFTGPFIASFFVPSDEARAAFTTGRILGYLIAELYMTKLARGYEKSRRMRIYYEFRGEDRVIFTKEEARTFLGMMSRDHPELDDDPSPL